MNLEFVRQVGRDNPSWLPTNLGSTCYAHTSELIRRIRAAGHEAWFVCKMAGEGGYTPPGFTPRTVTGMDGKPYTISLVSHDVIFFREGGTRASGTHTMQGVRQFDTLASANEHERTIYRIPGSLDVSFDPTSGPQIQASAVWNEVTVDKWRPWNPPLDEDAADVPEPGPVPVPQTPTVRIGRDEYLEACTKLHAFYMAPDGLQRPKGLWRDDTVPPGPDFEGIAAWVLDVYVAARFAGKSKDAAWQDVVTNIQGSDEWKGKHR